MLTPEEADRCTECSHEGADSLPAGHGASESARKCASIFSEVQTVQIPGSGRSPGEGDGYSLQYPCPENSTDRGALQATVHWVTENRTRMSD